MPSSCRISSLIPSGFVVDSEVHIDDEIVLTVRAEAIFAPCPICAAPSRRIHSRYIRHVSDLPASGRLVRLHIVTRRFAARHHSVQDGYSPSASTRPCFPFARAEPPGSKVSFIISALRLAAVPLRPSQSD